MYKKTVGNITLYNRYGYTVNLEPYEGDRYVLRVDSDHVRVGLTNPDSKEYFFIDPPGGPFMAVGSEIEGRKLIAISHVPNVGFIFTLESPKIDNDEID